MDEITIRIENDPTGTMRTGSKALENAVKRIENEMIRGNKASHEIAKQLAKIRDKKLYESAGYTTFSDFSEEYFGISKSNAGRLANVATRFLNTDENAKRFERFSTSQLIEMLKATDEQLKFISSDMRVCDIRDYLKQNDNKKITEKSNSIENADKSEKSEKGKVEVLDKNGEPVTDYTTKHFDSYADLLNFLHDNDVITDITITYKI